MPEDAATLRERWDRSFEALAGRLLTEVITGSDYLALKLQETGVAESVAEAAASLLRPHASDVGNVAIQLRSTAEMGAALRILTGQPGLTHLFVDTTLSLPLVTRPRLSLFYEHLKRLCCVEAREREIAFIAISKSHGLPSVDLLERLAREALGVSAHQQAEHWYLKVPEPDLDGWKLSLAGGRRMPPAGAVTYLFRLHRTTDLLRLDLDRAFWERHIRAPTDAETVANERRMFETLDYTSHDQRSFGYPYPLKAGHDRASLTQSEKIALRKQVIDAAVAAGMRRGLFRDASLATGHA
jgi:hypothetical protein